MARAVMDFKEDIGALVPIVGESMEESAYNAVSNVAGFRIGNLRVVIGQNQMNVYGTDNEDEITALVEWMIRKISETGTAK